MNWKQEFFELIEKELPAIWEEAVKDRRYLHMHPEVGFDTQNTEKHVIGILKELNIEILDAIAHNVPPNTPVYSYHWTAQISFEKPWPKSNQGKVMTSAE
jgi:metal-dependent amidase/aminoacylase/carboxypeptidase family protein